MDAHNQALATFDSFMGRNLEDRVKDVTLLKPSCHLTKACWESFTKFVQSHPGWSCRRRVATDSEKRVYDCKGRAFFVDVSYDSAKNPAGRKLRENNLKQQRRSFSSSGEGHPLDALAEAEPPPAKKQKLLVANLIPAPLLLSS
mmetsp:Transcript_13758/g.41603  ORF Transcript_13758/g.41603 Transcript_13758/m.41603 type:complete len:144 (-) Transcript_13758:1493-1924(-)